MAKNVYVAYLLWLIGGVIGLHLFYLRRDRHAFIWWATLGGVFGLGWLRDFTRIGEYVDDANNDPEYIEELLVKMRRKKPPFNTVRFVGQLSVGFLFAFLSQSAIPAEILEAHSYLHFVVPWACALGVNLVGNVGREKSSLSWAFGGAMIGMLFYISNPANFTYITLFSAILTNWKGKEWRRTYSRKHICKRLMILTLCGTLYLSLWGSAFYHNTYITTKDGEKVRVRDALDNFFNSQAWKDMKKTGWEMYDYYQKHGWDKMWEELVIRVDPEGEKHAYRVLDVPSSATDEVITKKYRELVKTWHPDKIKDPTLKEEAAQKFMEIQKAYETLTKIKDRRKKGRGQQREEF